MLLHTLRLTAFGPFVESQEIDFDAVSRSGLFLFEGPTGAGKSSVLDAVTFALYNAVSSDGSDLQRLHSQFAPPSVTPEVMLEFSIEGRRFRIVRTPEHRRPKKRGEGFTIAKHEVALFRLRDGAWELVSRNAKEVAEVIQEELGLNREQFTRVVLLPQGEFARFLKASESDRRGLLTKLFGADRFDRITDVVRQRAQEAGRLLRDAKAEVGKALAAAIEAGRPDDEDARGWELCTPEQLDEQLSAHAEALAQATDQATAAAAAAERARERAESELVHARDRRDRISELLRVRHDLASHQADEPGHRARQQDLVRGEAAASLRAYYEAVAGARAEYEQAERAVSAAARHLGVPTGDVELEVLRQQAKERHEAAAELAHAVELEAGLPARREALHRLESELSAADEELLKTESELDDHRLAVAQVKERLNELALVAEGQTAAAAAVTAWQGRAKAGEELDELRPAAEAAAARASKAVDAFQEARENRQQLTEWRLSGMAAELADGLAPGAACPVCGSVAHPAPALPAAQHVSAEELDRAMAQELSAQEERDAATQERDRFSLLIQEAQRATDGYSQDQIAEALATATGQLAASTSARDEHRNLSETLDASQASVAQLSDSVGELGRRRAALVGSISATATQLQRDEDSVVEALQASKDVVDGQVIDAHEVASGARPRTVAQQREELRRSASRLDELADSEQVRRALRGTLEAQEEALTAAMTRAGFAAVVELEQALLSETALEALRVEVSAWEATLEQLRGQLRSERFSDLGEIDEATARAAAALLSECTHHLGSAVQTAREAHDAAVAAREVHQRFAAARAQVLTAQHRVTQLDAAQQPLIVLDKLLRGNAGVHPMTLISFVLDYWFSQVVAAANHRLAQIAGGRYQLQVDQDVQKGERRSGLSLRVFDSYTGSSRGTGTLSGGETFYVSLSLALGLADVVQAEAGRGSLQTLFIDEGFGTLDGTTLEEVLGVIDGLRSNGRVVGIVSHVEDLKDRIPERIEVRRTRPDGPSCIRVVA